MDSGERWMLGHRPALDGLRGVAILLVLIAHLAPHAAGLEGAGVVGVTVFFTLSGFLITSLLADAHQRAGRVSLSAFYRRRAARLLPALYLTLALVLLVQWWGLDLRVSREMAAAVMLSVSNIWQLADPGDNGLSHTWSLGIEEQFYLLWPLALVAALRWRGRTGGMVVAAVGIALSAAALVHGTPAAASWGSLQRASSLLTGCLLSLWMMGRPERRASPVLAATGLVVLIPFLHLGGEESLRVAVLAVPAATAFVLWAVAQPGTTWWLATPPLRWFGRRSYALYLLHYPVLTALGGHGTWWLRALVTLGLTLPAVELSWRWVEQPFLRLGGSGRGVVGGDPGRRERGPVDRDLVDRRARRGGVVS